MIKNEKSLIDRAKNYAEKNVNFNIYNYKHIALEQNSNGIEYKITGKFGKIAINFLLDIVPDNNITPREIEYKYKEILEDKSIDILTFSV